MKVKESFEKYFKDIVPDYDLFVKKLFQPMNRTIRCNTLKINRNSFEEKMKNGGFSLKRFSWYKEGYEVLEKKVVLGNTLEHFLGYFYVQEKASMLPPIVLSPTEGENVLDIAASPGSKTSQMAQMMNNKGVILANDFRDDRMKILQINLQRLGVMNTVLLKSKGENFWKRGYTFDKVLVDAPCTSVGAIRKDPKIMETWNLTNIKTMSNLQKKILGSAVRSTKKGGTLVYSTCTLTREENEDVVESVLDKVKIVPTGLKFGSRGIDMKHVKRIYPQDIDSEGFFVAKMVKE